MGITNLDQLYLGGVPVIPGASSPPIYSGNWHYVNAATGADGNPGTYAQPYATLGAALAAATANNNDVVAFEGTIHLTASLAWNKANVHLIGLCSPQNNGKRARISLDSSVATTAGFNFLVNVSAAGCNFANFGTFYGCSNTAAALVCWNDTGGRNSYDNVEFLGFGDGTASTGSSNLTGSRAFKFNNNTGETTWRNCYFGADTEARNITNYTLEIAGNAPRLTFEKCTFASLLGASGGSSAHLTIGAAGIDRWCLFKECLFLNDTKSTGTAMTDALVVSASAGGVVLMKDCTYFGMTNIEAAAGSVYVDGAVPTGSTTGFSVVV